MATKLNSALYALAAAMAGAGVALIVFAVAILAPWEEAHDVAAADRPGTAAFYGALGCFALTIVALVLAGVMEGRMKRVRRKA